MERERYRLRVRDGVTILAYSPADRTRQVLAPREYEACQVLSSRLQQDDLEAAWRFIGADGRGGDLDVFTEDEPDLERVPDLSGSHRFEFVAQPEGLLSGRR